MKKDSFVSPLASASPEELKMIDDALKNSKKHPIFSLSEIKTKLRSKAKLRAKDLTHA